MNAQQILNPGGELRGGYAPEIGGYFPWSAPKSDEYLLGQLRTTHHAVTDSAASATSMSSGVKTFNGAINVDPEGRHVLPIARQLQSERDFSVGIVTSVAISHATPAAAYANNVSRNDYQDLARDLLGLPSVAHRHAALPGVDVLLGAGWGETKEEQAKQGDNFVPGNKFLSPDDFDTIRHEARGNYVAVKRTAGKSGPELLREAAKQAVSNGHRLFGFFGVDGGQLPYQTADGGFNPIETSYTPEDLAENPTLAQMTEAALCVLAENEHGFWLMVEAGDVDWANHDNNLDSSIGAVLSGDDAFRTLTEWVERRDAWDDTLIILTADHGHYLVLTDPAEIAAEPAGVAGIR